MGDYLLCYLTGLSRFIAVLEVTSAPFTDTSPIRADEEFPERVRVKPVVALIPETSVPIAEILPRLSIYKLGVATRVGRSCTGLAHEMGLGRRRK